MRRLTAQKPRLEATIRVEARASWMFGLLDFEKLITIDSLQRLMNSGGPHYFYVSSFGPAEAEMESFVI
jgi:hypothetical protein